MYRGVHPVLAPADFHSLGETELFANAIIHAKGLGFCKTNESVIIVNCIDGDIPSTQPLNMRLFNVGA